MAINKRKLKTFIIINKTFRTSFDMASKKQSKGGSRSQSDDNEDRRHRKEKIFEYDSLSEYVSSDDGKYSVFEISFVNFEIIHLNKIPRT